MESESKTPVAPKTFFTFDTFLIIASALLVLSVLIVCYLKFYVKKDFDFLVEAPCDATMQSCFVRDCDADECPVNQLGQYRVFHLSARDFSSCSDDSCTLFCKTNSSKCVEIICGDSEEDTCSAK